jgi:hypothetical protein
MRRNRKDAIAGGNGHVIFQLSLWQFIGLESHSAQMIKEVNFWTNCCFAIHNHPPIRILTVWNRTWLSEHHFRAYKQHRDRMGSLGIPRTFAMHLWCFVWFFRSPGSFGSLSRISAAQCAFQLIAIVKLIKILMILSTLSIAQNEKLKMTDQR